MNRIIRFVKQNKIVCIIGGLSLGVCVVHIFTIDVPELFPYGGEIFDFICNLLLAYIASVIFLFVDTFLEKDRIQEKYEKVIYKHLIYINNAMKEMIYILLGEDEKDYLIANQVNNKYEVMYYVKNIDQQKINEVFAGQGQISCQKRKADDSCRFNAINKIYKCKDVIDKNVELIITTYGKFLSDKDLDLLTSSKINNIACDIPTIKDSKFNHNHMVSYVEVKQHMKIQKEIQEKIEQIEASIQ